MEFIAIIESIRTDFDIAWGDTVRIRDIYTPFFDLSVRITDYGKNRLPYLKKVLLYSFTMHYANVNDEFDKKACLRNSKFSQIEAGKTIVVDGPIHRIRSDHSSTRFDGYEYVILEIGRHGREYDVNGDLNGGITEWLVEENHIDDEILREEVCRLVVAWECATLLEI